MHYYNDQHLFLTNIENIQPFIGNDKYVQHKNYIHYAYNQMVHRIHNKYDLNRLAISFSGGSISENKTGAAIRRRRVDFFCQKHCFERALVGESDSVSCNRRHPSDLLGAIKSASGSRPMESFVICVSVWKSLVWQMCWREMPVVESNMIMYDCVFILIHCFLNCISILRK